MATNALLSLTTFLPLVGAAMILLLLRDDNERSVRNIRYLALWTTIFTFLLSLLSG